MLGRPDVQHLALTPWILVPSLGVLIIYSWMLFSVVGISVTFHARRPDLAEAAMRLRLTSIPALVVFGLIPLAVVAILLGQYFFDARVPAATYLERVAVLLVAGYGCAWLYGRKHISNGPALPAGHAEAEPGPLGLRRGGCQGVRLVVGMAVMVALGAGLFFLTAVIDLLHHPGQWGYVSTPLPLVFSVQVVVHFLAFAAAGHLVVGSLLMGSTSEAAGLDARVLGAVVAVAASLGAPVLVLWDLYTAPDQALSWAAFGWGGAAVVLLLPAALVGMAVLRGNQGRLAAVGVALALCVSGALIAKHGALIFKANMEHGVLLATAAAKDRAEWSAKQEERYSSGPADPKLGERIFQERCTTCHAWDRKVVGPPYQETIPKYVGKEEELVSFVRKPVKKNEGYPPMPDPGLSGKEARAVSAYLLATLPSAAPKGEER